MQCGIDPSHASTPPPPTPCRYKEVVEAVFRFKDAKEKHVRRAVLALLPRMAAFSPERFKIGEGSKFSGGGGMWVEDMCKRDGCE